MIRMVFASALMVGAALPVTAVHAQSGTTEPPSATDRLQEGAAALVEGLRMLMDQLQSYEAPEVLPNGDIIIRRRPPAEESKPAPKPDEKAPADNKPRPL